MPDYFQWEIWQVHWLYDDGVTTEPRPALLISPSRYNSANEKLVFAKISSQPHDVDFRLALDQADPEFSQTGLNNSCFVYLKDVQEVDKLRGTIRRRGILSASSAEQAWELIQKALRGGRENP